MFKRLCPILRTNTALSSYECMKEQCEWYGHGCPAYPNLQHDPAWTEEDETELMRMASKND